MTAATFGSPFYCPLYVHWPFSEVLIACRERPELRAFSPFANDPGRTGSGRFYALPVKATGVNREDVEWQVTARTRK